ncbi:hypothetical protein ACFL4U_01670 [Candidatus Neomarinimicrobiota bacterium]
MRRIALGLLILFPVLLTAQVELGPFLFMDKSKANNITLDAVVGSGGLGLGLSAEKPAPKFLEFLNFIPGYAMRYQVVYGGTIYGEATVIARVRYQPERKYVGYVGLGPGLGISTGNFKIHPTVSVVFGADILLKDKYLLSVALKSVGILSIGFGVHKGYGF